MPLLLIGISIVSYRSSRRWVRETETAHAVKKAKPKCKPGRPRTPDEIRKVLLRLAKENSWGCATNNLKKGSLAARIPHLEPFQPQMASAARTAARNAPSTLPPASQSPHTTSPRSRSNRIRRSIGSDPWL